MVALTDDRQLVLVEQYRRPLEQNVIELPAGLVGDLDDQKDESLEQAARRELIEETGYQAKDMTILTEGPPSPGLTNEKITLYLATGLKKIGPGGGDKTEIITVQHVPIDRAGQWLNEQCQKRKILVDPKVYAGIYFAQNHLEKQN